MGLVMGVGRNGIGANVGGIIINRRLLKPRRRRQSAIASPSAHKPETVGKLGVSYVCSHFWRWAPAN